MTTTYPLPVPTMPTIQTTYGGGCGTTATTVPTSCTGIAAITVRIQSCEPAGANIVKRFIVGFIIKLGRVGQLEHAIKHVPDFLECVRVGRVSHPDGYNVLVEAHGEHGTADFVSDVKLFADDGQEDELPVPRRHAIVRDALGNVHTPLAATAVCFVFPDGLCVRARRGEYG